MNPALIARGLRKSYQGEAVLAGVDLVLHAGEAGVLIGPSGSGKTTLLSILGGLLRPDAGGLWLDGELVAHAAVEKITRVRLTRLGFIAQHVELAPLLAIEENLALEGENAGMRRVDAQARASELIVRLGLADQLGKCPEQLSAGQRRRVAVARALLHRPPVLLADDPTSGLNWRQALTVVDLLVAQARIAGVALLMATHDMRLVPRFDRVFLINSGRLQERSPQEEVAHA